MSQVREHASSFRKIPLLPSCGHLRISRHAPQSCWNWLANWLWKWVGRSLGSHQWAPWRCFLPGSIQDTDPQSQLHLFFYLIGRTQLVFCYWQLMNSFPYFSVSVPRFGVKEESKAFHKCLKLLPVESGRLLWRGSLTLPGLLQRRCQPDTPWIVTKSDQNGASHVSRLTFILGTRVLLWATYVAVFLYLQSGTCLLLLLFFF